MKKSKENPKGGHVDTWSVDPESIIIIDDKEHPLYDERCKLPLNENMVKSIMARGVINSILARWNADEGQWEVIDGRQRVLNCREANRRLKAEGRETHAIAVRPRKADDAAAFELFVMSNKNRRDDPAMRTARNVVRYIEDFGKSHEEAMACFNLSSVASVKRLIALADVPSDVARAVDAGKLSVAAALDLAKQEPEARKAALATIVVDVGDDATPEGAESPRGKRLSARRVKELNGEAVPHAPGKKVVKRLLVAIDDAACEAQVDRDALALVRATVAWAATGELEAGAPPLLKRLVADASTRKEA